MAKRLLKHVTSMGSGGSNGSETTQACQGILKANGPSILAGEQPDRLFTMSNLSSVQEPFPPGHPNGSLATMPTANGRQDMHDQIADLPWPGMESSTFPFDWAIQDMFDFGVSNIFRDPMI